MSSADPILPRFASSVAWLGSIARNNARTDPGSEGFALGAGGSKVASVIRLALLTVGLCGAGMAAAQQPNIILIVSDDAGFADWGFMDPYTASVNPGQAPSPVPTPNLDRLRARGVLFTDAYTAAVCSPSRAAILTGSYPQRIGYEFNINNLTDPDGTFEGLRAEDVTLFERMKALGYTTGAVGKWHVGGIPDVVEGGVVVRPGNRPPRQGVDEFFGILRGSRSYNVGANAGDATRALREMSLDADGLEVNTEVEAAHAGEYVTNTFGQGAVDFIGRHHADSEPFFLYLSFTAPHGPIGPSPDRGAPGISSDYGSMVFTMDREIGRVMDKVADPAGDGSVDLTAETLCVFINDNGGASGIGTRNDPLRNWKGSTFEGGIRVPMIFAGAGVTAAPGSTYSRPVHSVDLLATCHELAGGAPLAGIDGVNLLPFINGEAPGDPHAAVVVRNRGRYGVRMGDWKLTRNGGGAPLLFDLAAGVREGTEVDVAAEHPAVVADLLRALTEHEAGFDKPRFHGLSSNVDSINRNDRFVWNPSPPAGGVFVADKELVGPGLRNGDFESPPVGGGAQADRHTYAEADSWANTGTGSQDDVLVRNNLNRTSAQNAVIPDSGARVAALDTGHTLAAGEVFGFSYWWRDASNWNDGADRVGFAFYTTADDTSSGARVTSQEYLSGTSTANATYEFVEGVHRAGALDDGRRLFVAFRGVDGNGSGNGFARVDDISVARGVVDEEGGGVAMATWSAAGAWTDADTGLADTLLDIDAFSGAVLEFPVADGFSYVASNDMVRATGETFMVNRVVLSGGSDGGSQTVTMAGNALLFADARDGVAAMIENRGAGAGEAFFIEAPIIAWDRLVVGGEGRAPLTISGPVADYDGERPSALVKQSSSALILSGMHPFSGGVTIEAGTLAFDGAGLSGPGSVEVSPGATLAGRGSIGGGLSIAGTLRIDFAAGDRVDVAGALDLAAGAVLELRGAPSRPVAAILGYGSLVGEFAEVDGLPAGYVLDLAYEGNQVALVATGDAAYTAWAEDVSGLAGAEAAAGADPNGDGVPNGIAFFIGASDAVADARSLLPQAELDDSGVTFRFGRSDAAVGVAFSIHYSLDLSTWSAAADGEDGVSIAVIEDVAGPGRDEIAVTLPAALVRGGRVFLRLSVEQVSE